MEEESGEGVSGWRYPAEDKAQATVVVLESVPQPPASILGPDGKPVRVWVREPVGFKRPIRASEEER